MAEQCGGTSNINKKRSSYSRSEMDAGFVDTSKAEKAMWLMKCPPLVSRSLSPSPSPSPPPFASYFASSDAARPGASRPIAKVILSLDPLRSHEDDSSPQFTMELTGSESGNMPKCYSMDISKDFIPMSVLSESSQGRIAVEGKILNRFDVKPHNEDIKSYAKLCRERTNKYMVKSRQIQVIDNDKGTHMRPMPLMNKKKVPTRSSDMKRTRRERGEMEEIMFKLFERQSNWTLKLLIQETDQPEQFLKDILKELCVYNNKGPHQGTYELKPEYRRSEEPTAPP